MPQKGGERMLFPGGITSVRVEAKGDSPSDVSEKLRAAASYLAYHTDRNASIQDEVIEKVHPSAGEARRYTVPGLTANEYKGRISFRLVKPWQGTKMLGELV
jgi:hypothetical protein